MGYSEEIIHQQKEALKALPVFVKNQNDETTETQQSITHKYRAQSVHENSRIGILNKTQSSLRNTYQIRNTSGETFHFRQKGGLRCKRSLCQNSLPRLWQGTGYVSFTRVRLTYSKSLDSVAREYKPGV